MKIPFVQKKGSGNICAQVCLANIFFSTFFLKESNTLLKGMTLAEENELIRSYDSRLQIEDCCKDIRGIKDEAIDYYINDSIPDGFYGIYLFSVKKRDMAFHRTFMITDGKTRYYVDPLHESVFVTDSLGSIIQEFKELISISFIYKDKEPMMFTRSQLKHLIG